MNLLSHDERGAVVHVSWDELAVMYYATSEAVRIIDAWEFPTLVGAPFEVAKALRGELGKALDLEPSK
jgi:hypothetical protein